MRKSILNTLTLLIPACYLQAQTLKISVQKGQKYKIETSSNIMNSMKMFEDTVETSFESTSTIIFKVTDLNKNEIELESTCTHITSRSTFMGKETSYDSDKKEGNDSALAKLSKRIGQSKKISVDHSGKVIKEEKPENPDPSFDFGWMMPEREGTTELFMPEFIGKEFKEGYSFPVATAFSNEKPSTNFSFNKETVSIADTGTYKIDSIRNGIASISYTGFQSMSIQMKMADKFVTTVSKTVVRSDFRVEMNTGIVISKTTTDESEMKTGAENSNSKLKDTVTVKVTLLQ